jgi:hypothetical protein
MPNPKSGQSPFVFSHCDDLRSVPQSALPFEAQLHGSFAVDKRAGFGQVFYGMPGLGLLRASADLTTQDLISLPPELTPVNFHSTKIGEFEGKTRLFLAAEGKEKVAVVTLDGDVEWTLSKPEFAEYESAAAKYLPTDTALAGDTLFIADGYGSNFISKASVTTQQWAGIFGGHSDADHHHGFGTAHGISLSPAQDHLVIADRANSRLEHYSFDGQYQATHGLPAGSRPCGIDFTHIAGKTYAVVGSLDDPQPGRAAPIYILDGDTFEVLSTLRPKEDLGLEKVDHLHNVVWHHFAGRTFLVCQSWNPGFFFVLEHLA